MTKTPPPQNIETKNKWLIFLLIATGSVPASIIGTKNSDGKPIVQYSFEATEAALKTLDLYTRGLPIPVPDARVFEDVERNFKNNVDRLARGER